MNMTEGPGGADLRGADLRGQMARRFESARAHDLGGPGSVGRTGATGAAGLIPAPPTDSPAAAPERAAHWKGDGPLVPGEGWRRCGSRPVLPG